MNHERSANDRREGDRRIKDLRLKPPVRAGHLVGHVTGMRAAVRQIAMARPGRVEMAASAFVMGRRIAGAGLVDVKRYPMIRGQARHIQLDQHARRCLTQLGLPGGIAFAIHESGGGGFTTARRL